MCVGLRCRHESVPRRKGGRREGHDEEDSRASPKDERLRPPEAMVEEEDDEGPGGPVRNPAPAVRPPEAKDAVKKRDTDGRTAEQAAGRRDEVPRRVSEVKEDDGGSD